MFGTKKELERWENGEISDKEKLMAAYALNLCTVSVSQIVDYSDLVILEQEYEAILNNLNLENFPKDEALLDILKQILDTITFFRIQEGDKKFIDREYQQKMKNAIWSAVPNIGLIVAGGNPITMAISLASQVGIGYMNYRKEKANNQLEYDKQKWQLQRSAIEQFNALRRELFTTAWRLADKYNFPDEYRLTEKQISQYNDILMDANLFRKYERLCAVKENFEAYPPFWYYLGNAANAVAQEYFEEDKTVYNKYKDLALESFNQYWKVNNLPLLRKDDIAASCALEHIDLFVQDGIEVNKEKINELLGIAIKNAGNSWDIIQLCTMNYLRLGNFEEAKKYLRILVTEDYNAPFNAQILTRRYVEEAIKEKNITYNYPEYVTLQEFVNPGYLYPWPENFEDIDKLKQEYLNRQKAILKYKYASTIIKLVEKYTVLLNRQTQCPADDYEKEYTDSYFLDTPEKIARRKEDCELRGRLITSRNELGYRYVQVLNDFLKSVKSIPLFSNVMARLVINKLQEKKISSFFNFQTSKKVEDTENKATLYYSNDNVVSECVGEITDIFDLQLCFGSIVKSFMKCIEWQIKKCFSVDNQLDESDLADNEKDLFDLCSREKLPLPSLEINDTSNNSDDDSLLSITKVWGDVAENYKKIQELTEKQVAILKSYKEYFQDKKIRFLLKDDREFINYCQKNKVESREEILAILDDMSLTNTDLFFMYDKVVLQEGLSCLKVAKAAGMAGRDVALVNLGAKVGTKLFAGFVPGLNIALMAGDAVVAYRGFNNGMKTKAFESNYCDIVKKEMSIQIGKCEYKNNNIDFTNFIKMLDELANTVKKDDSTSNNFEWFDTIFKEVEEELNL